MLDMCIPFSWVVSVRLAYSLIAKHFLNVVQCSFAAKGVGALAFSYLGTPPGTCILCMVHLDTQSLVYVSSLFCGAGSSYFISCMVHLDTQSLSFFAVQEHWFTIRRMPDGSFYNFNSLYPAPEVHFLFIIIITACTQPQRYMFFL